MTKFNPENKDVLTYGECLDPAMEIEDPEEAEQYLKDYATYIQKCIDKEPRGDDMDGFAVAKINLGYWAGYYDDNTRKRVEKLFKCSHPFFGSIEDNGPPTAEEAFKMGVKAGKKSK